MPDMHEIYAGYSVQYDRLVDREDYQGNLRSLLRESFPWKDARVLEAGCGSGRVTEIYADLASEIHAFDGSAHMLEAAKKRLARFRGKLRLGVADNDLIPFKEGYYDVFIQGWSFGHSVSDSPRGIEAELDHLVGLVEGAVHSGGVLIFIETLGTMQTVAGAPSPDLSRYYKRLEGEHGFARKEVRTDYRFPSAEEAAVTMGFFFGEGLGARVRKAASTKVPEWTGVWTRTR